jgi:hypothetical protein
MATNKGTTPPPSEDKNNQIGSLISQFMNSQQPAVSPPVDPATDPLLQGTQKFQPPPTDRLTNDESEQVVKLYSDKYGLTPQQAVHSITFWCLGGVREIRT